MTADMQDVELEITNRMRWGDGGRHTACGKMSAVEGETGYGDFVGEREPDVGEKGEVQMCFQEIRV
jgi:hypothetical protein